MAKLHACLNFCYWEATLHAIDTNVTDTDAAVPSVLGVSNCFYSFKFVNAKEYVVVITECNAKDNESRRWKDGKM